MKRLKGVQVSRRGRFFAEQNYFDKRSRRIFVGKRCGKYGNLEGIKIYWKRTLISCQPETEIQHPVARRPVNAVGGAAFIFRVPPRAAAQYPPRFVRFTRASFVGFVHVGGPAGIKLIVKKNLSNKKPVRDIPNRLLYYFPYVGIASMASAAAAAPVSSAAASAVVASATAAAAIVASAAATVATAALTAAAADRKSVV